MKNSCRILVFGIALLFFVACRFRHQTTPINSPLQIAFKKLGSEIDSFPNSTGKLVLFVQLADPKYPTKIVKAMVLEVVSNNILFEESFVPGFIKWKSEYALELLNLPGTIKSNEDISSYIKTIKLNLPNP